MKGTYQFDAENWKVTDEMMKDYDELGYIIVKGFLNEAELTKMKTALENPDGVTKYAYGLDDGSQRKTMLTLWAHPGNDITGMMARSEKMVTTSEILMGGKEVYHYHTKFIMKEPYTGGSFVWHQDYGYWYKNGCLRPDLNTVWVAVDRADKRNGCLQIIPGSHKCGRIEHLHVGAQTGADVERVEAILNYPGNEFVYVELQPGDALFFHCNLLHKSEPNNSEFRRWAFLCSYCRADNNPVYVHHHPQYTPLHKVPDSAILACDNFTDLSGKEFLDPKTDKSVRYEYDSTKDKPEEN